MKAKIQSQSFPLTTAIQNWIENQLQRNLQRFDAEVLQVDVYLSDLNGPRGGKDSKVVMRANLAGLSPVTVVTEHDELYVAVSRSAKRLRRAVKRSLHKNRRLEPRKVFDLRRRSLELASQ